MIKKSIQMLVILCFVQSMANVFAQVRFLETEGTANIIYDTTFTHGTEEKGVQIPAMIDLMTMQEFSGVIIRSKKIGVWTRCNLPLKGKTGLSGSVNRQLAFKCRPVN